MTFTEIYNKIVTNKKNHEEGNYNCLPFTNMERLEAILPGIEKATYYILTSGTGVKLLSSTLCVYIIFISLHK